MVRSEKCNLLHNRLFYLFAAIILAKTWSSIAGQVDNSSRSLERWKAALLGDDLNTRREVAVATRSVDRATQEKLLPIFITILKNEKDGQVRLAALDTLTDMGPSAAPAVEALLHTLQTDYGGKRNEESHQDYRSAMALAAIGQPAVEGLRGLLSEKAGNVRAESAMALGRIGPPAASAIPELIVLLGDEQPQIRHEASRALGRIGKAAIESLLVAAQDANFDVRRGAIASLGNVAPVDDRVVDTILLGAESSEPKVRAAAVTALSALQVPTEIVRKTLLDNLNHHDESVRTAAINVLVERSDLLQQIESDLATMLTSDDDGVAWHAAFLLQRGGSNSIEILLKALRNQNSRVEQIAKALALIGRSAVAPLTVALDDDEPRVRQAAALALGQIRPLSEKTIHRLTVGLKDTNQVVQAAHLTAIGYLGTRAAAAIPEVRKQLQHESPELREQAINILFHAAPRNEQLVEDLTALIDDVDPGVQQRAIDALRSLGPLGYSAVPSGIVQLESPHNNVRIAAAALIGSHGRIASKAVPALTRLLQQDDVALRVVILQTLSQLGPVAQPAFEELTALSDHENVEVRAAAVQALGSLDFPPEQLRPCLAKALHDEESDVRRQAIRAIRAFGRRGTIYIPDLILLAANDELGRFLTRTLQRYERYEINPSSIPELIELLKHERETVRLLAIRFLGLAGPSAKAIAHLHALKESQEETIRLAALTAIEKIQARPAEAP